MIAHPLNLIRVQYMQLIDNKHVAVVDCNDYDDFRKLPDAIEINGKILGKTGWSSDRHYACYKENVMLGKPVRIVESRA